MGKETRITCDSCGKDVFGGEYFTIKPRRVKGGKQHLFCTIWLCKDCFNRTKLQALLFQGGDKDE